MKIYNKYWWIPLSIGILIYLLFRTDTLLYNKTIGYLFHPIAKANSPFTVFLTSSLPDGLWAMSYSMLIFYIRKDTTIHTFLWALIAPLIGIGSEIGQWLSIIPGTFDIFDIIAYTILTLIIIINQK